MLWKRSKSPLCRVQSKGDVVKKSLVADIDRIGPVLFERSRRSRHLNIFVAPFKGVRVAVPYGISFEEAERITRSYEKWVLRRLANMKRAEHEYLSVAGNAAVLDGKKVRDLLKKRIDQLSRAHGFSYDKLIIRAQKAQWGSCSPKNRISLNIKLAQLPEELIDYVIMHELAHTRIKNHGKRFWRLLDGLFGDAKALDSRLRRYHLELL